MKIPFQLKLQNKMKTVEILFLATGLLCMAALAKIPQEQGTGPAKEEPEYVRLVVAVSISGIPEDDRELMLEQLNEITKRKLGIQVELAAPSDYNNRVNLMLAGNEQLDIVLASSNMFLENYMNSKLAAIDELLKKYGQGIIGQVGKAAIDACRINGRLYGVPNNRDYAAGSNAYMLRKDILDKYGIDPDEIRSMEDLEKVFDTVKKGEPDMTVLASGAGTMLAHLCFTLGGGLRVGAHMDYGRDDELVNLYETQEYLDALLMVRRWYMRGYLDQDILGQTENLFTRVRNGELFAYTTKGRPGLIAQEEIGSGREMVCVQFGENAISYNSIASFQWAITQNTVSAEKSMKLLNLFYTDADIMNLLCYGVEGVHYVKTEDGHITYADEEKGNPFVNNAWKMPNQFITHVWEGNPLTLWKDMREFNENAIHCCDLGFNFDVSKVSTEYAVLNEIYSRYKQVLENGLVNPREGLKAMNKEMKDNGIDEVIEKKRQQYEEWKTRK